MDCNKSLAPSFICFSSELIRSLYVKTHDENTLLKQTKAVIAEPLFLLFGAVCFFFVFGKHIQKPNNIQTYYWILSSTR